MWEAFKRSQELLDLEQNMKHDEAEDSRQRVVTSDEAKQFLTNGWKFLGTLQNGNVVIEKYDSHPKMPARTTVLE